MENIPEQKQQKLPWDGLFNLLRLGQLMYFWPVKTLLMLPDKSTRSTVVKSSELSQTYFP